MLLFSPLTCKKTNCSLEDMSWHLASRQTLYTVLAKPDSTFHYSLYYKFTNQQVEALQVTSNFIPGYYSMAPVLDFQIFPNMLLDPWHYSSIILFCD